MNEANSSLPYATPSLPYASPARAPRLAAAVWIGIIGLALIGFGGCFMIGIMAMHCPNSLFSGAVTPARMTVGVVIFMVVMYAIAIACFGGATVLLLKSVKTLFVLMGA